MALRFVLLATCLYLATPLLAQEGTWKKISKTADQLYTTGAYEEAANYYLEAYKQKNSRTDFLYRVANCYDKLRFYQKAANFYKEVKDHKDFPMAPFEYARSLKQSGNYDEAITAFKSFLVNYKASDHAKYVKIVKTEIDGCELALSGNSSADERMIEHLSDNINTMANEVAPLPFNEDIVYFSSTMEGFSKIYRSQLQGGEWTKAVLPKFPEFKDLHVAHGSFTPDNSRFYFTLCQNTEFDVIDAQCDIYVTVRTSEGWNTPRKLRDYVKLEGKTATHPFVMHEGDMEILYFSSDRKGGQGGMDIWFMTRHIDSPEYDFTLPKNVGSNVNTYGDEVTPYYNAEEGLLYYSSNGHASIGGFDVFKSLGSMSKFSRPQNLGTPINSSADDYYFMETKSGSGAFLSSNRTFGNEKVSTDNDDIFYFGTPSKEIFASGNIYNKSNNSIIHDVQVILHEVKESGKKRLLQSIIANNGAYQFSLIPERHFEIEVIKEGYASTRFKLNTIAFDENKEYGQAVYLVKETMVTKVDAPVFEEASSMASIETEAQAAMIEPSRPVVVNTPVAEPVSVVHTNSVDTYVNSFYKDMEVRTSAPKLDGVYFKVQVSTAEFFNESDPLFDSIRMLGQFHTEYIKQKGWTRILVSEFFSLREAKVVMEKARTAGFPEAFVVKYRNGRRLN